MDNKLKIIDLQDSDMTKYIFDNILHFVEDEEVVVISSDATNIDVLKLYEKTEELTLLNINTMTQDDYDDCANTIVILEEIDINSEDVKDLIDNSYKTYYLKSFYDKGLTEIEAEKILDLTNNADYQDISQAFREMVQVIKNNEFDDKINIKEYVNVEKKYPDRNSNSVGDLSSLDRYGEGVQVIKSNEFEDKINGEEYMNSEKTYDGKTNDTEEEKSESNDSPQSSLFKSYIAKLIKYIKIMFNRSDKESYTLLKRSLAFGVVLVLILMLIVMLIVMVILVVASLYVLIIIVSFWFLYKILKLLRGLRLKRR